MPDKRIGNTKNAVDELDRLDTYKAIKGTDKGDIIKTMVTLSQNVSRQAGVFYWFAHAYGVNSIDLMASCMRLSTQQIRRHLDKIQEYFYGGKSNEWNI